MLDILLQTKLYIPRTRPNIVPRTQLIDRLNDGLRGKLTMISAPAGFGKTTLITEWLSQLDRPVGWISLDEDDSVPQQFFSYAAAALRPFPNNPHTLNNHLQSQAPLPTKALVTALINDCTAVSTSCLFVLDDYHLVESAEIDMALAFLLDHMPPNLQLVINSRSDPGFPLSRLRARNQLTELRADDLRFSVEESTVFLQTIMDISLTPEQIAALEARTEGWIAGLQMAALSMQNREDVASFIDNFTGNHRFIMDYLTDEVLQQSPPAVQDFLLQTSILTRMNASLCTAVTGSRDNQEAQGHLDYLDRTNLFLIPLDDERIWYRYHHLFADLLQKKQGSDVLERHQRASRWYEENGLISDALHHAHAAGDVNRVTQLIVANTRELVAQGKSNVVLGWIRALPEVQIRTHPLLAIGKAWDFFYSRRFEQVEPYLVMAEAAMTQNDYGVEADNMRGEILTIRAFITNAQGQYHQTIALCQQALQYTPPDNLFAQGMLFLALGRALQMHGNTQAAITTFRDCQEVSERGDNLLIAMGAAHQLSVLYVESGRLRDAAQFLTQALTRHEKNAGLPALGFLYADLAAVAYEQNELEQAADLAQTAVHLAQGEELLTMLGYANQAKTAFAAGDVEEAKQLLAKAAEAIETWPFPNAFTFLAGWQVKVAVATGDLDLVRQWQEETTSQLAKTPVYEREARSLILARLLIAQGRLASSPVFFSEALALLLPIEETAAAAGRFGRVMEAQMLHALAQDALNNDTAARQQLAQALTLEEAEGFVRTFVDEGEPLAVLLRKMEKQPYTAKLLAAFPSQPSTTHAHSPSSQSQVDVTSVANRQSPLIEPLSEREIEILTLISEGKKNKEIADELFISYNTVLYHTKNLYGKLGVNKRTQAVLKAQELGLI